MQRVKTNERSTAVKKKFLVDVCILSCNAQFLKLFNALFVIYNSKKLLLRQPRHFRDVIVG